MAWAPTTEQILNLDGVRRRSDSFVFELCDRDLQPIGELHPDRDGSAPQIQNDTANNSARRLSGLNLMPSEAADVNPVTDRLRVYMVLQNGESFRLGTFIWGGSNGAMRSWGTELHSDLVDYSHILGQQSTQAFGWNRGATISLIMFFLFFRAAFTLDDIAVVGEEASRGLAEPKSWQPGTTWAQMLNDLGVLVGFVPPWVDRDGRFHFDAAPNPAFDAPTVEGYDVGTRIIADSIVPSNDLLSAPNDFGVFDSGTDRIRTGRYQLPASAPHSFQKRGWRIGRAESVQGLETQDQANAEARNLARKGDAYEWLTFDSTADPRHDTWDVVEAFGQLWLETSWSLELRSGGPMRHTMKRVTYDVV